MAHERERAVGIGEHGLWQGGGERPIIGAGQAGEHGLGLAAELSGGGEGREPVLVCADIGGAGAVTREHEPDAAGQEVARAQVLAGDLALAAEAHRALAPALLLGRFPAAARGALAVAEREQHAGVAVGGAGQQLVGRGGDGVAELDDILRRILPGGLAPAHDLDAGGDQRAVADGGRGGAVVDREEHRIGLGRARGAPLPAQDLVDIGGVVLLAVEGEATDITIAGLDLLQAERDLVEVAEDQLIARDLEVEVGPGVELALLPAHRLVLGHLRRHAIDLDRVALLRLTMGQQRRDDRQQAVALGAERGDHAPALGLDVVRVAALVPEVTRLAGLRGRPLAPGRRIVEAFGEHRRVIVGVDHQEVQVGCCLLCHVYGDGARATT